MLADNNERNLTDTVDRRRFLQALGVTSALSLAGCAEDEPGDEEHGERVPPIVIQWWAGAGGATNVYFDMLETMRPEYEELGFELDLEPIQYTAQMGEMSEGSFNRDATIWFHSANPDRLDPHFSLIRYGINRAGNTGTENPAEYVNCEFTDLALQQQSIADPDERREVVYDAIEIRSNDKWAAQVAPMNQIGAYRTDYVDLDGVGDAGIYWTNPAVWFKSEPLQGDEIVVSAPDLDTANWWQYPEVGNVLTMHQGLTTPLMVYDENFELHNAAASHIEVSDDNLTYTIELEEYYWQNGDQVTAEDWQFTLEMIQNNLGVVGQAIEIPYAEINAIEDQVLEIVMEEPYGPFITRDLALYGAVHRDTWEPEGALEDIADHPHWEDMVHCGPYKITAFSAGDLMELTPRDDGRDALLYNPDHRIILRDYEDSEAVFRDFQAENVHVWNLVSPADAERIQDDDQLSEDAEVVIKETFTPFILYYHNGSGIMKHEEIREALGMAMNRERVSELAHRGLLEPDAVATKFTREHPFRPPDDRIYTYTDDMTGDVEGAREVLSDAGFTWDGDGNLRLPLDRDLEPRWDPDGVPTADDGFACMSADGEFIPEDER